MRSTSNYTKYSSLARKAAALVAAAVLVFTLAGCFHNEPTEEAAVPANAPAASPAAAQTAEALPVEGGEFNIPMPMNPSTLNPLKVKNAELANIYSLIFESPVDIDTSGQPQPCLAETWDVSDDGKTWTFHLRKGIKFHGDLKDTMTAKDVEFTLDMLKDIPADKSVYGKLNGMFTSYSVGDDDYTFIVKTDKPNSAVLFSMVFPVLSKEYYENASGLDEKKPVGTGPYKLDNYDPEKGMTLSANQDWWKTKPFIQKINAVPMPDNDTELASYQNTGDLDFVPTSLQTANKYSETGKTTVLDYNTQYYDCLMPNINNSIFSDPNVRKALAFSIDRGDLISKALLNHAVAADFPVPPDSWLYDGKLKIYEYNTSKAQELLSESGWKDTDNDQIMEKQENGQTVKLQFKLLVLKTSDITYKKDVANLLKEQLKSRGFDIIEIVEKEMKDYKTALEQGNFDLALCSFYMDRNPDLNFILHSNGSENYSRYANAEMDNDLKECTENVKEDKMKDAYGKLQQKFVNDLPHIGLYFRRNSLVYRSDIQGIGTIRELDVFRDISKWYITTKNVE
jgi:peptide/nickel transport system substrate-binding protein